MTTFAPDAWKKFNIALRYRCHNRLRFATLNLSVDFLPCMNDEKVVDTKKKEESRGLFLLKRNNLFSILPCDKNKITSRGIVSKISKPWLDLELLHETKQFLQCEYTIRATV
jgi:hypothetical protein